MKNLLLAIAIVTAAGSNAAFAQSATSTSSKDFGVTGNVPPLCVGGTTSGGDETFALGVLIDTATGLLRGDLASPDKVVIGSFCSARSTIAVAATPLAAQNFTAAPPSGFARTVNYTATASGRTATPASYATAAASNAAASQSRDTAFSGPITVGVAGFSTTGGNTLRLVADTAYSGTVTITLTAVS